MCDAQSSGRGHLNQTNRSTPDSSQDDCQQLDPPSPGSSTTSCSDALFLVGQMQRSMASIGMFSANHLSFCLQLTTLKLSSLFTAGCRQPNVSITNPTTHTEAVCSVQCVKHLWKTTSTSLCVATNHRECFWTVSRWIWRNCNIPAKETDTALLNLLKSAMLHNLLKSAMLQSALQDDCAPHWHTIDASMRHLIIGPVSLVQSRTSQNVMNNVSCLQNFKVSTVGPALILHTSCLQ